MSLNAAILKHISALREGGEMDDDALEQAYECLGAVFDCDEADAPDSHSLEEIYKAGIQQLNSFGEGASALAEANSQQTASLLLGNQSGAVAVTSQLVHELVALQQRSHEQLLSQQQEIRDLAAELAVAKVNEERQRWEWEIKDKAETAVRVEVALAAALEAKESAEMEAEYAREEVEELKDELELQQRSSLTAPSPKSSGDADDAAEAVTVEVPPPAARARSPAHAGRRNKKSPGRGRKTAAHVTAGHKPWGPPTANHARAAHKHAAEPRPQSALPYLQEPEAYTGDALHPPRVVVRRRHRRSERHRRRADWEALAVELSPLSSRR
jgi:hypothetical protein